MRLFNLTRTTEERLLWSRDIRFVHKLAARIPNARQLELDSGSCLIGPAEELSDALTADIASDSHNPDYGLVNVDSKLSIADRYVVALASAVQVS